MYVTASLFTVLLATNMGEATFFSPGGAGGLLWTISIIGGYCIDMRLMRANHWENRSDLFSHPTPSKFMV